MGGGEDNASKESMDDDVHPQFDPAVLQSNIDRVQRLKAKSKDKPKRKLPEPGPARTSSTTLRRSDRLKNTEPTVSEKEKEREVAAELSVGQESDTDSTAMDSAVRKWIEGGVWVSAKTWSNMPEPSKVFGEDTGSINYWKSKKPYTSIPLSNPTALLSIGINKVPAYGKEIEQSPYDILLISAGSKFFSQMPDIGYCLRALKAFHLVLCSTDNQDVSWAENETISDANTLSNYGLDYLVSLIAVVVFPDHACSSQNLFAMVTRDECYASLDYLRNAQIDLYRCYNGLSHWLILTPDKFGPLPKILRYDPVIRTYVNGIASGGADGNIQTEVTPRGISSLSADYVAKVVTRTDGLGDPKNQTAPAPPPGRLGITEGQVTYMSYGPNSFGGLERSPIVSMPVQHSAVTLPPSLPGDVYVKMKDFTVLQARLEEEISKSGALAQHIRVIQGVIDWQSAQIKSLNESLAMVISQNASMDLNIRTTYNQALLTGGMSAIVNQPATTMGDPGPDVRHLGTMHTPSAEARLKELRDAFNKPTMTPVDIENAANLAKKYFQDADRHMLARNISSQTLKAVNTRERVLRMAEECKTNIYKPSGLIAADPHPTTNQKDA